MDLERVVREVVVRGSTEGMDNVARSYDAVSTSSDRASASLDNNKKSAADVEAMIGSLSSRLQDEARSQQQYSDAIRAQSQALSYSVQDYAIIAGSIAGAAAAFTGFMDKLLEVNKGLADMQTLAKMVGLSLADFQGLKLGAAIAGISDSDLASGLQRSAQLLNDASRNANTLSKELAENGISVKQANGDMITQNQLLGIAAELIKRARNPGDQSAIAQMLGFTQQWIPLLEQGSGAMAGLTAEAKAAGAVIDDSTIERASEFDRAWRKSSVEFSSYMKAAALGLLPYLDDLVDRAAKFVKSIDLDAIEAAANRQLKVGADAVGLPDEAAFKIQMPQSALDNWDKLGDEVVSVFTSIRDFANDNSSLSMLDKLYTVFTMSPPTQAQVTAKIAGLMPTVEMLPQSEYKWNAGTAPVFDTSDAAMQAGKNTAAWTAEGAAWTRLADDVAKSGAKMAGEYSKVAGAATDSKGAMERAKESIEKYIQVTDAAAATVGDGVLEQEKAKVIAQLKAAALRDGLTDLDKYADAWGKIGDRAGYAAQKLATNRAQDKADFQGATMFMSSSDQAIAATIKDLYGRDWQSHMDDALAKQTRMNDLTKQAGDAVFALGNNMLQAFASGKTGADALLPAIKSLGSSLTSIGSDALKGGVSSLLKGGSFNADPTALGIGAAGFGLSLITNMFETQRAAQDAAEKAAEQAARDALDRISGYNARAQAAAIDTTTLSGDLVAFDMSNERKAA